MLQLIKRLLFVIATSFFIFSCSSNNDFGKTQTEINTNWSFKSTDEEVWLPANVPGCVHTDLIENKKIKDPFYRLNEHDVQWVDKKDWEYKTTFTVDEKTCSRDVTELVFEGLDTYADVYLNDSLILSSDNMFRSWKINCKKQLRNGENSLKILFHSPIKVGLALHDSLGYKLPVSDNDLSQIGGVGDKQVSIFLRKAGYHFGWDWGPRLVTSGIWKPIYLNSCNLASIEDVFVSQDEVTVQKATLTAKVEIEATSSFEGNLFYAINDGEYASTVVSLQTGLNTIQIPLSINTPNLWWPNGMGDQTLYTISFRLNKELNVIDNRKTLIGLRNIKVVQTPDSAGKSFYFEVNGVATFMKGANYIPQDVFLDRVTPMDYERVIQSAVDANMNMLRVWGGGIYEKDVFYDLCDQKGILVWQDFMFACAMFPGDEAFLENVKQEAVENVRRLRNHPSIALWCGNNEILSAWNNWGWKNRETETQGQEVADRINKTYEDIFHKVLPEAVKENDPSKFYWASSPQSDTGVPENLTSGDMHYWGVWWGKEPFTNYEKTIPRFMSEFGFQSFPNINTVRKYAIEDDWDINSEVMKSHQRSSIGNNTIKEYMLRHYQEPKNFPMFLYVNHVLQAEGIRIGIEAQRRNKPYCMGSLYWQINDCWPVASWSSSDYYGNWKALHYAVRKAFKPIIISTEKKDNQVEVYIVSDTLKDIEGTLSIELLGFGGEIINTYNQFVTAKANQSEKIHSIDLNEFIKNAPKKEVLLHYTFVSKHGKLFYETSHYLLAPKALELPSPTIKKVLSTVEKKYSITLQTDLLAKNVYLNSAIEGHFSDNYFDLLPGKPVTIYFTPKDETPNAITFEETLKVVSLVDTY